MKLFKKRKQRISVEIPIRISLQSKEDGSLSKNWQQGHIVTLSRDGASIIVEKVVLDGQHLFFAAQNQAEKFLFLENFNDGNGSEQKQISAEAVWMDSCTINNTSAFKIGLRFTEEQSSLFESFKEKSAG